MLKAIIFDFDGVVVDSEPLYQQAEERLFKEYGVTVPAEDCKYFKGSSEETFYSLMQTRYGINAPIAVLRQRGRELLRQALVNLDYMPGFLEFYYRYRTHLKMGLVTSTPAAMMEWIFANTRVQNLFPEIITADDVTAPKPDPQPFLQMFARLQVKPQEALIIEDSMNGLVAALASGAKTIAFLSSLTQDDLPPSVYPASNYHEVENYLKTIIG